MKIWQDSTKRALPRQDLDVVYKQLERFGRAQAAHSQWKRGDDPEGEDGARTCYDFVEGRQWRLADYQKLRESGRPALKWNRVGGIVRQVQGYQRQNRFNLAFKPGDDELSTQEVADDLNFVSTSTASANQLTWKESEVFRDGIVTGRGFYDVRLDFSKNLLGSVRITVDDPFATYPDPESQDYDPKLWKYVFTGKWLTLNDVLLTYGKDAELAAMSLGSTFGPYPPGVMGDDDTENDGGPKQYFGQFDDNSDGIGTAAYQIGRMGLNTSLYDHLDRERRIIRVIDQQHYVPTRVRYFVDMQSGQMKAIPQDWSVERIRHVYNWAVQQQQQIDVLERVERKVRWTVTAADVVLHDDWSPYRTFTKIPFFAYHRRGITRGMVHDLLDPQREINKRRSAEIHIVGTSAYSGWHYAEDDLDTEQEENLRLYGSTPGIHIKHRAGKQAPVRIDAAPPPTAMERLEQRAQDDLKEISGVNDSATGNLDRVQSGKAIIQRQKGAVTAMDPYLDNLARSRTYLGEKMLEIYQDHYTEQRFIRGGDEYDQQTGQMAQKTRTINQVNAAGIIVNGLNMGTYLVAIDDVPAAQTFNDMQFDELLQMFQMGLLPPQMVDLLLQVSTAPNKRVIIERLKAMQAQAAAQAQQAQGAAAVTGQPPPEQPPPHPAVGGGEVVPLNAASRKGAA